MRYKAKIRVGSKTIAAKITADSQTSAYNKLCSATSSRFPNQEFHILEVSLEVMPDAVNERLESLKNLFKFN